MHYLSSIPTLERIMFSYHFLDRIRLDDEGLKAIANLVNMRELGLFQTRVRGHTLAQFVNLQVLDVGKTPFDDEGLRNLSSMNHLTRLWAPDTQITDNGLQFLSKLPSLEDIDLHSTAVTDTGLQHLRPLTHLRKLNLMSTDITDAGLANLEQMKSLEQLSLYRTRVTNAGLEALKELKSLTRSGCALFASDAGGCQCAPSRFARDAVRLCRGSASR